MATSWHEGGSDVLTSAKDLYVALGVRLRERPGARWVIEMHPETSAGLDPVDFETRFGARHVWLQESRHVVRGEYRLSQRGFDASDAPMVERGYADWRRRLTRNLSRKSDGPWDALTFFEQLPAT
jgi:hypothetical protein